MYLFKKIKSVKSEAANQKTLLQILTCYVNMDVFEEQPVLPTVTKDTMALTGVQAR